MRKQVLSVEEEKSEKLKAKLNKNNVHILSIIGDGGIGKTAIVLKLLYDLLDEENCKWELIL